MTNDHSVFEELGVPTVVNATGTKTRIGGSRIREEAVSAMADAATDFARISDLQARASGLVADITGADAGYVASGAASAMTLGAAATIAGDDLGTMTRLPNTDGVPSEIAMPRTHRTGYDHALRAAGADIVDIGTNDRHLGTGATNVETWEIADAITAETVAVAYVQKPYTQPPLEAVVDVAHDHGVPVIVDAAAELPPASNLSRFIDTGADLVVFSGGKAIRGPQSTGILAGRKELIESAALQHLDMHAADAVWDPPRDLVDVDKLDGVPRQGIGRGMKVGKEELVGLITALDLFVEEDHDAQLAEWRARASEIADGLAGVNGIKYSITGAEKTAVAPEVVVTLNETSVSATELVSSLRREDPRVFVGADRLEESVITVNPMCLTDTEAEYVVARIRATLD